MRRVDRSKIRQMRNEISPPSRHHKHCIVHAVGFPSACHASTSRHPPRRPSPSPSTNPPFFPTPVSLAYDQSPSAQGFPRAHDPGCVEVHRGSHGGSVNRIDSRWWSLSRESAHQSCCRSVLGIVVLHCAWSRGDGPRQLCTVGSRHRRGSDEMHSEMARQYVSVARVGDVWIRGLVLCSLSFDGGGYLWDCSLQTSLRCEAPDFLANTRCPE